MRLPVLANLLVLLAVASPLAFGLAAEVEAGPQEPLAVDLPPEARPVERALDGLLGPRPEPEVKVDLDLLDKASVALSAGGLGGADGYTVGEIVAAAAPPAVAAAGAFALLQLLGGFRGLAVGAVALYSRLTKSDLLDNEHRDKVYKLVQEQPGIGLSEVAQRTGLGWGTTVYHLDRLERAQMLASERMGGHRRYFPMGTVPRASRKGIGTLKADTTRSVAAFLAQRPGASQTELCEGLGLSASAASKQVTKLEDAGLVRRERDGKTVRLWPEPTLAPLLGDAPAPGAPAVGTAQAPAAHAPAAQATAAAQAPAAGLVAPLATASRVPVLA